MKKQKKLLVADFETTSDPNNPQVYSWGIYDGQEHQYGISIETFFDTIKKIDEDCIMYFHNGSKFDAHFILPVLSKLGYKQRLKPYNHNKILKLISMSEYKDSHWKDEEERKLKNKVQGISNTPLQFPEYEVLANGNSHVLELKISLPSFKVKYQNGKRIQTNRVLIIRDSNLLFTGSIKKYGDSLNKHYHTKRYTKGGTGAIDYDRTELYNSIEELENDGNELEYLKQDNYILYSYLDLMSKQLPFHKWKMTSASTSYENWKEIVGERFIKFWLKHEKIVKVYPNPKSRDFYRLKYKGAEHKKTYSTKQMTNQILQKYFSSDWMNSQTKNGQFHSQYLYNWYSGGITQINPMYKGIKFKNTKIGVVDINSAYPSVMKQNWFPYGAPYHGDGGDEYPMKLYKITTTTKLFNKYGMPFLFTLTGKTKEYRKEIGKGQQFYITDIELERVEKYYSGKFNKEIIYSFRRIAGDKIFGDYINKYYKQKQEGKEEGNVAKELDSKMNLNSLYGKFGSKTNIESSIWNDKEGVFEKDEILSSSKFYLPLAIWITAYARMKLVDAVDTKYDIFVYCDTDSIFFIQEFKHLLNIELDPLKLGAWDVELEDGEGVIRRKKQYKLKGIKPSKDFKKRKIIDKIGYAGMNLSGKETTNNDFIMGATIDKQLRPNRLGTGVYLEEYDKDIKPIWEYDKEFGDWFDSKETYFKNYPNQIIVLKNVLDKYRNNV